MRRTQKVRGRTWLEAEVPSGWAVVPDGDRSGDLTLQGPGDVRRMPPRVVMSVRVIEPEPIECASIRVMDEMRLHRPGTYLTTCDMWPHPVWGTGRYLQSTYATKDQAYARDCYLFLAGELQVTIVVECLLADLLNLEDLVAAMVAAVKPAEQQQAAAG